MVIPDARQDERFHDNPLVTGPDGIRFYAGVPVRSQTGHALGALCVVDSKPNACFSEQDRDRLKDLARMVSDKLEVRRLERTLQKRISRSEGLAASTPNAVFSFDRKRNITFWNAAAKNLFGYTASEIVGQPVDTLLPLTEDRPLAAVIENMLHGRDIATDGIVKESYGIDRRGSTVPIEISLFCCSQDGDLQFGAVVIDMTERRQQQVQLHRMANFDELTAMPNRALFSRRVEDELRRGTEVGILVIDLDYFKDINNTLGRSAGDQVLTVVADRMRRCIRVFDTAARLGSDEFGVLLIGIADSSRCMATAQSILSAINEPLNIHAQEVRLSASCGVSFTSTRATAAEELIGNAELALFQAKGGSRGRVEFYIPALREQAQQRRQYHAEFHRAVEKEEFELYYQPQVRLSDSRIVGAEALLRWKYPQRGYLSPAAFLPALERSSVASAAGAWIVEEACAQTARWLRNGVCLRTGINLFAAQLSDPVFAATLLEAMRRHRLPAECVEIEITENIILAGDETILGRLRALHDSGIGIAFDDFGTGYASLSMLRSYPLTRIKIDQVFIRNMCSSRRDEATVRVSIELARNHELSVIAEGVETVQELDKLMGLGCDEVQGYYFGKPMSASDFNSFLVGRY